MPQKLIQSSLELEQHLTQVLQTSNSSENALLGLTQAIGEAFLADCCMIVLHDRSEGFPQSSCWHPDAPATFAPVEGEALNLLGHSIAKEWKTSEPLAIRDFQTISWQSSSISSALVSSAAISSAAISSSSVSGSMGLEKAAISRGIAVSELPQRAEPRFRAVLLARTEFQGRFNGMIVLMRSQPYEWKESDVQLLKILSPQIAIAISQVHLDQQIQRQIQYQTLIDQLTTAIRNSWSQNQIFQLAVEGTVSALQVSRGMIFLFKYADPLHKSRTARNVPKTKAIVATEWLQPGKLEHLTTDLDSALADKYIPESPSATLTNHSFWASECSICQPILTGQSDIVVIPTHHLRIADNPKDLTTLDQTDPPSDQLKSAQKISPIFNLEALPSLLLVPLENQGTVLGCLVLQHHQHRLWLPEEIAFVKLAAAQLSTAIIQTRTIQQIQAVVQERTAQLQRSLDVQAKLYEKTRQQVEQLRRLNQEREEFLSTVSHELRTPLTSMTLAIRMLRQANLSPERQAMYLDILEQQCMQETNLINDLLALRKLGSNLAPAQLQKLDIRYLIRDVIQSVESSLAEKDLKLNVNIPVQPLLLYTDSDSLNRILVELLTNARKYSEPGSTIQFSVLHEINSTMSQVVLTLRNYGDGIPAEELPYIFDKFRRGQGVTKQAIQGTGLGLALVKGLVEHLNGAIAVTSHPLEQSSRWETSFTVTVPQCPNQVTCDIP